MREVKIFRHDEEHTYIMSSRDKVLLKICLENQRRRLY